MSENLFTLSDHRVAKLTEDLRRAKADYETELTKFHEQASTNFAYALEWQAKHVLRAQARYEIAASLGLDDEGNADPTLPEVAYWLKTALSHLQHSRDGESDSTSALTNVKVRVYAAVEAQYVGMLLA